MISYNDIKIGARVSAVSAQSNRICVAGEIADLKDGCYAWVRGVWDGDTITTGYWVHFNDLGPSIVNWVEPESQPVADHSNCKMCTAPIVHGLRLEFGHWLCTPCVIKTCEAYHGTVQADWRLRAKGIFDALNKVVQEAQACFDDKSP